jgi:pimeloyl-ACP methyl ester carboxylesterase
MSFFAELKRRNVFKVGIAYAIVAWLLVQVIVAVEKPLHLPEWADTFVIVLLVIGFPIALLLAWAFELTPEGIKKTPEESAGDSTQHKSIPAQPSLPATRFCTAGDGVRLAYMTVGQGPPLVKTANWLSHLELDWSSPISGPLLRDLSAAFELTLYDERGNGLSDWDAADLSLDAFVGDLETVVEAAGLQRFALLGFSQGCAVSIAYAARHPDRLSHLVLFGGFARDFRGPEQVNAVATLIEQGWGQKNPALRQYFTSEVMPNATKEEFDAFNELQRVSTSPENAARLFRSFHAMDVTALAPTITVPTLVLHARLEQGVPFEVGREMAALIPGSRFVSLEGENHFPMEREPAYARFKEEISRFINKAG